MDENKNLTPENENENTTPGEVSEEATDEIIEEISEEAVEDAEEISEEAVEDAEEISEEAVEENTQDFAVVAGEEEETLEDNTKQKPSSKKGLIAGIISAVVAFIIVIALAFVFMGSGKSDEGTGNLYSQGMATIKGNYAYHVNFADYKMYKTNLKTGESVIANETDFAQFITNYKNQIYYLGVSFNPETQETEFNFKKYVDGVNDVVMFSDAITSPQISDGYVYYLKSVPEFYSGYCSRIYRAELKEGSVPELVCDVLCNAFYVDGKNLYYGDVDTTTFSKVTINTAMKAIAEFPLTEGEKRSSESIGAEPVIQTVVALPTIYKNSIYFIDCLNQYEFCSYDMKTGEIKPFNSGLFVTAFNIYGDYIFYHNQADYSVYRMKLDGSDIIQMTAPGYGYTAISNDKFMSMEITEEGYQYISVSDLDGNLIRNITFEEQYEAYFDEYAIDPTEETEEPVESDVDSEE